MHGVEGRLVTGIGMDGGHHSLFDAEFLVQHIGQRGQAVGGAGGVGDHHVVLGEGLVVDAEDDGLVGAVAGSGDDHLLGAGLEMGRGFFLGGEDAGAFERDVDAHGGVRQVGRIAFCGHLDRAAAYIDGVAGNGHGVRETAMDAVEAQQMRIGFDRAEIVDGNDFDIGTTGFDDGAQDVAADAAKAIDGDANCHVRRS